MEYLGPVSFSHSHFLTFLALCYFLSTLFYLCCSYTLLHPQIFSPLLSVTPGHSGTATFMVEKDYTTGRPLFHGNRLSNYRNRSSCCPLFPSCISLGIFDQSHHHSSCRLPGCSLRTSRKPPVIYLSAISCFHSTYPAAIY